MATPGAGEARLAHLQAISQLYAQQHPHIASYWGATLLDLKPAARSLPAGASNTPCPACGCLQTAGNASQNVANGALNRNGSQESPSDGGKSTSVTTCNHCHRYTNASVPKRDVSKLSKITISKIDNPSLATDQFEQTTSSSAILPGKVGASQKSEDPVKAEVPGKAKRKQKKGGLAAMLARSKESTSGYSTPKALGFADLAKRT